MGLLTPGGIDWLDQHLSALKSATLKWLDYEHHQSDKNDGAKGGDTYGDESLLLHLAVDIKPDEVPEQPEPLGWARRMRRLGIQIFDGGLYSQPYIFSREIDTVVEAENEHSSILAYNLKQQSAKGAVEEEV